VKVNVTDHAAERYVERVKPHLTKSEARDEITRLVTGREPEPYCDYVEDGEHFDAFMELAPGITLGLRHEQDHSLTAVTTMIRTG
jgi:hypothetical protein